MAAGLAPLVALAVLAAAVPASAAARPEPCAVRDANVFAKTRTGILFAKSARVNGREVRRIYGCLFSTDVIVRLGSRRVSNSIGTGPGRDPVLAGRYVAFAQSLGEETATGAVGINVVDLQLGRRVAGYRYTTAWDVGRIVLRATGGVAWAGNEPRGGDGPLAIHVNKIDGPHRAESPTETKVVLDERDLIYPRQLRLTHDGRGVTWVRYDPASGAAGRMIAPLG